MPPRGPRVRQRVAFKETSRIPAEKRRPAGKGGALYAAFCSASTKRRRRGGVRKTSSARATECRLCTGAPPVLRSMPPRAAPLQAIADFHEELIGVPHVAHVVEEASEVALVVA